MCNVWNTNGNCGCGGCGNYALGSLFNNGYQFVCRDACGNIRVNDSCAYHRHCGCCRHACWNCGVCGNGGASNTQTDNGATGGYGCVTVCGRTTNPTATANNGYYTQNNASRSCGCGCYYR